MIWVEGVDEDLIGHCFDALDDSEVSRLGLPDAEFGVGVISFILET